MGYNKIQRKITAFVYGKRKLNRKLVRLYRSCDEVKRVLNDECENSCKANQNCDRALHRNETQCSDACHDKR